MRSLLTLILVVGATSCEVPVRQCAATTDCFGGEACVQGECVFSISVADMGPQSDTGGGGDLPSGDCRLDESICGSLVCNVSTGRCESCQRDLQCGEGGICDMVLGRCACAPGFHDCGGTCARDDSPDTCGERCEACPSAADGEANCTAGVCVIDCAPGFRACGDCPFVRECIECESSTECGAYDASKCGSDGLCEPCEDNGDCGHLDRKICVDGTCRQCDTGQAVACGSNSCNPATFACTQTPLLSREWCESCVADSECEPNHRCIPMNFGGSQRASGYCLEEAGGPCLTLATVPIQRESLSGIRGEFYCTIREDITTCEAMKDFSRPCFQDIECGVEDLADGKCRTIEGVRQCTYGCTANEECSNGTTCIGNPPDSSYCARF